MKFRLTQSEFNALFTIVEMVLFKEWPKEVYDKLLQTLFTRLYQRLYKIRIMSKSKYRLTISEEECLAFHECLSLHDLKATSFEGNFLNKMIADIDRHFAIDATVEATETKNYLNKI